MRQFRKLGDTIMRDDLKNMAISQLKRAIEMARSIVEAREPGQYLTRDVERFVAYAVVAVAEITGEQSVFSTKIAQILDWEWTTSLTAEGICGVIEAVIAAIDSGLLEGYGKLIRGDLFSDYLDMAHYLLDEGYKDAAAVIAGSSLEVQLRSLCDRQDIPTGDGEDGKEIPKKAESLNTELRKQGCYDKTEQKLVTAWLGIRNDAAHGNYENYSSDMVESMVMGIRGFISNHS